MYVKYKLRNPNGHVIPKGPSFSSASTYTYTIDGTQISFKAPKHRPLWPNDTPVIAKPELIKADIAFNSNSENPVINGTVWKEFKLFYHTWAFYGPWFTGAQADLRTFVNLITPESDKYQEVSLFHPRAFESAVGDYLTSNFSQYISESMNGRHHFIAPDNWQPLNNLPVSAVRLRVRPDEDVVYHSTREFIFFPISNETIVCFNFDPSQIGKGSQEERDKRVSREPMLELVNNIINSIKLTLSPEAQSQQKKALKGLEDTSLVKDYPPLKWSKQNSSNVRVIKE